MVLINKIISFLNNIFFIKIHSCLIESIIVNKIMKLINQENDLSINNINI